MTFDELMADCHARGWSVAFTREALTVSVPVRAGVTVKAVIDRTNETNATQMMQDAHALALQASTVPGKALATKQTSN